MYRVLSIVALTSVLLIVLPTPAAEKEGGEPAVPAALKVPSGYKLLLKADAKGVQIYKSVEGKGNKFEWVLEAPRADLFDADGKKIGRHYAGPSWETKDGSKVVRDKTEEVKTAPAPSKDDIPWLLIKVKEEGDKKGTFSGVGYIQRVQTRGGKAPAEQPKAAGVKREVPYQATYLLYGKVL